MNIYFSREKISLSLLEGLLILLLIVIATYLFVPAFWEPGGESLKNWVSAKVFGQTDGFPVFSHAPFYNLYLQFFLLFDYPLSIQMERSISSLFAYSSFYFLVRRYVGVLPAFMLTAMWIPVLWTVEGGARLVGIGFFCLYLGLDKRSLLVRGYLPIMLLAAALTESAYVFCLVGHVIGTVIDRRSDMMDDYNPSRVKLSLSLIVKAGFIALFFLTISFQSKMASNNIHGFEYPWAPVPLNEIMGGAHMQIGNWYYVRKNLPEDEWINSDWYNTHKDAYGSESLNLIQAAVNSPKIFFGVIWENLSQGFLRIPVDMIFGSHSLVNNKITRILAWLLLFISLIQIFLYFRQINLLSRFFALTLGAVSTLAALSLVYYAQRYYIVLLPFAVLIVVHIVSGVQSTIGIVKQMVISYSLKNIHTLSQKEGGLIKSIGLVFLAVGILTNYWSVSFLLSLNPHEFDNRSLMLLMGLQAIFLLLGVLFAFGSKYILFYADNLKYVEVKGNLSGTFVALIAILGMYGFQRNHNVDFESLVANPFVLSGSINGVSMYKNHKKLLSTVDNNTRVLALEEPWIKTFADVGHENIFHIYYLPPFKDDGDTEEFLKSLDVIWVSDNLSKPVYDIATQKYLRYMLHVKPFLEKFLGSEWKVESVDNFGKVYRKITI